MKTNRGGGLFLFLLILAGLFVILGEAGLYGNTDLLEYAAPYSPQAGHEAPLQHALDDLQAQMPDAQLSASVFKGDGQVQTPFGGYASCSITGIAPGWFDLYPHRLLEGRFLGEAEIAAGEHAALITSDLAYALWGDTKAVGNEVLVNGASFRVIGVVEPSMRWGQPQQTMLCLPLQVVLQQMQPDIQILSGSNVRLSLFDSTAKRYIPSGTCCSHEKERMSAGMPLRYLCVAILMCLLLHTLRLINGFSRAGIRKWQERYSHVYSSRMIVPSMLLGLQWLIIYSLWVLLAYGTLQLAIAPVYVFSEWIPEDLSSLRSYIDTFARAAYSQSALQVTRTESVLHIRRCGTLIMTGCILFICAMALPRKSGNMRQRTMHNR